ncbi:hypothetical protein Pfo_016471 [Paulownia fortunei]|nr:hypothetical protein Pfo_016471 [Paulownia fortunei]
MTRKRVKLEKIPDERKRDAAFTKMVENLTQKANDLSILCGVDICIVIHKPTQNNAVLWPCPEIFGERLRKFMDFSELERSKKIVIHEKYLEQRLNYETEYVQKSHNKKDQKESQLLMNELLMQGKNFNEVDMVQLNSLQSFTAVMLKKLENRDEELNSEQQMQHFPLPFLPSPLGILPSNTVATNRSGIVVDSSSISPSLEDLRSDSLLTATMFESQNTSMGFGGAGAGEEPKNPSQPP